MFWAAFSSGKRTALVHMQGDPNAPRGGVTKHVYLKTLKTHLPTIMDDWSTFMHGNAPIYNANIIQEWFYEEVIDVVEWPLYSPDLNLLKNLWKMLKAEIIRAHLSL